MFRCRVCLEKENRINDLQSQIEMLRKVAFPALDKSTHQLRDEEVDRILSGSMDPIDVSPSDNEIEAASLLTGSYDRFQVNVVD